MKLIRQQWLLIAIFISAILSHAASLCFMVRHFGESSVSEIGYGFATVYWSGDKTERDLAIYNCSQWPVRPETHYAGAEELPAGMKWESESPNLELSFLPDSIRYRGFFRTFGYALPQLRHEDGAASFLIPIGSVTLIVEICALFVLFKGHFKSRRSSTASKQDLTGSEIQLG